MVRRSRFRRRKKNSVKAVVKREVLKAFRKTVEVKHDDITFSSTGVSSTPQAYNLCDYISQGDGATHRSGNLVNLLSTSIRSHWVNGDSPYNMMRIALVEARLPLPLNILQTSYDATSLFNNLGTCRINANFDYDVVKRVFFDKLSTLREFSTGEEGIRIMNKRVRFGKLGKKIHYDGDQGLTLGDNTKTYIYLVLVSDSGILPHPAWTACIYNRYTDM